DEWPGPRYRRDDPVLHIAFRGWADLLVIAPLDANTLAKFALGLADNFLTCLLRAWDDRKPVVLAPAMNTLMWDSPATRRHLRQLLADRAEGDVPEGWTLDEAPAVFARHAPGLVLVPPRSKRLACGDVGLGAMAEVDDIVAAVRALSSSPGAEGSPQPVPAPRAERLEGLDDLDGDGEHDGVRRRGAQAVDRLQGP
ncbi:MAG TPA: flavoprotein, partial [Isosphaeraceae bacterium]